MLTSYEEVDKVEWDSQEDENTYKIRHHPNNYAESILLRLELL
jgi:hypothetical protein